MRLCPGLPGKVGEEGKDGAAMERRVGRERRLRGWLGGRPNITDSIVISLQMRSLHWYDDY